MRYLPLWLDIGFHSSQQQCLIAPLFGFTLKSTSGHLTRAPPESLVPVAQLADWHQEADVQLCCTQAV